LTVFGVCGDFGRLAGFRRVDRASQFARGWRGWGKRMERSEEFDGSAELAELAELDSWIIYIDWKGMSEFVRLERKESWMERGERKGNERRTEKGKFSGGSAVNGRCQSRL
jgi:hypothetical protein